MKAICIRAVYSIGKYTHLYSITGNFLIRQVYTQAGLRVEATELKCGEVVQQTLIIRYYRTVRVEAIMAYGSQGSYLLCILELHIGLSEGAGPVLCISCQSDFQGMNWSTLLHPVTQPVAYHS